MDERSKGPNLVSQVMMSSTESFGSKEEVRVPVASLVGPLRVGMEGRVLVSKEWLGMDGFESYFLRKI